MLNSFEEARAATAARPRHHAAPEGAAGRTAARRGARWAALAVAALVAACGGGGGDSGSSGSSLGVTNYNLQRAYRAFLDNGSRQRFTAVLQAQNTSGVYVNLCSGTADIVAAPARNATFATRLETPPISTRAVDYTNTFAVSCTIQTQAGPLVIRPDGGSGIRHFDATSYGAVGEVDNGNGGYGRYESPPNAAGSPPSVLRVVPLPDVVSAGGGGEFGAGNGPGALGTQVLYTDANLTTRRGHIALSYRVDAGTAVSVLAHLTAETYNTAGTDVLSKQVTTYRVTANDTMTLESRTIDYSSLIFGLPVRLVLTQPTPLP